MLNCSLLEINEIKALSSVQSAGIVSTIVISIEAIKKIQEYKEPLFAGSESLLPLIVFEVSQLLKKYPILNAYFENDIIRIYNDINIGVALDIDNGLKVYTIKNTEQLSISSIEKSISIGVDHYLDRSLTPDQLTGSTFTITDLSSFGASVVIPLINLNQAAILGISTIDKKLNRINVSLSFDHRVTEGKVASQFLSELKERIEAYLKTYSKVDNDKLIHLIRSNKPVTIEVDDGVLEILPEEFVIDEIPINGYGISSGKNIIVGVYTEISEELKQEGMVRDLIRQVQNLRKDSGLKVEDRIEIGILGSKELNAAVQSHESYFMNEVLGVKLDMTSTSSLTFNDTIKIDGKKITIGISPTH